LRRQIRDEFKDEIAETSLASSYVLFLKDGERCKKCSKARMEVDPWYKCETCDQYIGGLTNVKMRVRDELLKERGKSLSFALRTYLSRPAQAN
jgi:hypothetical protein